jgi:hypothetical protein
LAVIDLRNCTLWLVDGTVASGGGSVTGNWAANLPFQTNLASQITISGTVAVGNYINFASHLQFYEVLAVSGSQMTIYPALLSVVTNGEPVTVLGNGIYCKLGEGNLTYSEKRNVVTILNRGFIDTVRAGDDVPIDVSMDFTWEFLRSAGTGLVPTIEEALKQIGQALDWVSTSTDECEPYCLDLYLLNIPGCGTDAESIRLPEFRWTSLDHDLKGGKVSIKATCNALYAIVDHTAP